MPKPKAADELQPFYDYLMQPEIIKRSIDLLAQYCAIKSVSGDATLRQDCFDMVHRVHSDLHNLLGIPLINMRIHKNPEDQTLPPILTAHMGKDPNKATLLVYGHLDVQPAPDPENWITEDPFVLTKIPAEGGTFETNKYYARGATDDKGPVLGWINALKAYQDLDMEIPVNIKFLFECMEESGGIGLEKLVEQQASFFEGVDAVCISDNYWLGLTKPCVTYGLRGISYYNVTIECAHGDLHSGVYGGTVREALIDMIHIFSKLTDGKGTILIDGVNDSVLEMTDDELKTYDPIDFDPEEYRQEIGTTELLYPDKVGTLTHRWRYPSLSIHGFVGASDGDEDQTVIPRKVKGKFSIRLVPDQDPEDINAKVEAYVRRIHAESGSKNPISFDSTASAPAWVSDNTDANYKAGINAQQRVYGVEPDLTREGGSIPVTLTLQNATNSSVMLLPIGQSDDGAHSQNEKMSEKNYINGAKVLGTYLNELGKAQKTLKGKKKKHEKK